MIKVWWKQDRWLSQAPMSICRVIRKNHGCGEGFYIPSQKFVLVFHEGRMWVYDVKDVELAPETNDVYQITEYQPNRLSASEDTKKWLQDPLHIITNYLIMRDDDASTSGHTGLPGEFSSTSPIPGRASRA